MRTKILKCTVSAVVVALATILLFLSVRVSPAAIVFAETPSGLPLRLIIPRIHVNAAIEKITGRADEFTASPKVALNTGWYESSSLPGEKGTAVIGGVVHWKYGPTAMFGDLHFLKAGDSVTVENDRGEITSFIVQELRTYELHADISEVLSFNDGTAHLNLITFDGSWDAPSKSYSKRLVVFADRGTAPTDPETGALSNGTGSERTALEVPTDMSAGDFVTTDAIEGLAGSIYGR